jgi:hypothetical protein
MHALHASVVALETPVAPCGSANLACAALVDHVVHRHWIRPQTLDTDGYNADRRVHRRYACLPQQCPDTRILSVESRDYLDMWILDTEQTLPDTDRHAQTLLDTTDTAWIRIQFKGVFPEWCMGEWACSIDSWAVHQRQCLKHVAIGQDCNISFTQSKQQQAHVTEESGCHNPGLQVMRNALVPRALLVTKPWNTPDQPHERRKCDPRMCGAGACHTVGPSRCESRLCLDMHRCGRDRQTHIHMLRDAIKHAGAGWI